jgi:hypothetical protein
VDKKGIYLWDRPNMNPLEIPVLQVICIMTFKMITTLHLGSDLKICICLWLSVGLDSN